jgi:ribonuclease D
VLQVASGDVAFAVDCLAPIDLAPLLEILFADDAVWVLHSARQDLEVLATRTGKLPGKLIDTQIAAALTGSPLQIGLQAMLLESLNVAIGKEHTRADWSQRPLPDAVLQYALDDVRYLLDAWRALEERLRSAGRLGWFEEDCERTLRLPIQPDPAAIFERTGGAGKLQGKRRAAAFALIVWREARAEQRDRPRRWILADDLLVQLATALPQTLAELEQIRGLPPKLIAGSGTALLTAIQDAEPMPDLVQARPPPDKMLVKRLQALVRERAESLGVPPELLATRKDIAQVAAGQTGDSFMRGWRGEVLAGLFAGLSGDSAS